MFTRKRFMLEASRIDRSYGAGYDVTRVDDTWRVMLWHALPFPFVLFFGWSRLGWHTSDGAEAVAQDAYDRAAPGVQGQGFLDAWEEFDAADRDDELHEVER